MRQRTQHFYDRAPPGRCGSKNCLEPRAEGRYVCSEHAVEMVRIREEFQNASLKKMRRVKRAPTCCAPGCYEPRDGTRAFCDGHRDNVEEVD